MPKPNKRRTPEFKYQLAVEAIKGDQTITQLAAEHGIHPRQITRWRDQLLDEAQNIFVHKSTQKSADPDKKALLHMINQLTMELDFLKKKLRKNL